MSRQFKILVVEDNPMYSFYLSHYLSEMGNFAVQTAATGKECIELLNGKPDLVVLDYFLPDSDGLSLLKEIKKKNKKQEVVIISNQPDVQLAVDTINEGAVHYIKKNNDALKTLAACIEELYSK